MSDENARRELGGCVIGWPYKVVQEKNSKRWQVHGPEGVVFDCGTEFVALMVCGHRNATLAPFIRAGLANDDGTPKVRVIEEVARALVLAGDMLRLEPKDLAAKYGDDFDADDYIDQIDLAMSHAETLIALAARLEQKP